MPSDLRKNKALLFGGIGLVLAAIGVIVSLILINQPQDTRQQAAVIGGTAEVRITPATVTLQPGKATTATVAFSTKGSLIQGLSIQLQYAYVGTTLPLDPTDLKMEPTLEALGKFACTVKQINKTSNPVTIDFSCTMPTGYSNTNFTDLFTFVLTAGTAGTDAPVVISFNPQNTIIAQGGQDIAAIPTDSLTVTLPKPAVTTQKKMGIKYAAQCNPSELKVSATLTDNENKPFNDTNVKFSFNNQNAEKRTDTKGEASVTMTYATAGSYPLIVNADGYTEQRSTIVIAACPTPTPTPAPTATPSAKVSCNGNCSTSVACDTGLTCYSGRCRSASCQSDTTCLCKTTNVASTSSTTQLPVSGSFDRTLAMLLVGGLLTLGGIQVLVGRGSSTMVRTNREYQESDE